MFVTSISKPPGSGVAEVEKARGTADAAELTWFRQADNVNEIAQIATAALKRATLR